MAGLITLVGLNALNPDRFIAQRNVARFTTNGTLDTYELSGLSADAAPVLVAALPMLSAEDRATMRRSLACERDALTQLHDRLGSWNLARSRAAEWLDSANLGSC